MPLVACLLFSLTAAAQDQETRIIPAPAATSLAGLGSQELLDQLGAQSWPAEVRFELLCSSPVLVLATSPLQPAEALQVWQIAHDARDRTGVVPIIVPDQAHVHWASLGTGLTQRWSEGQFGQAAAAIGEDGQGVFYAIEAGHREAEERAAREIELARAGNPSHPAWEQWVQRCDADPAVDCQGPSLDSLRTGLEQCPDELLVARPPESGFPGSFGFLQLAEFHRSQHPDLDRSLSFRVLLIGVEPHLIPLLLGFGGFNECPSPEEHSRAILTWEARYGIHLVFMGPDTLEFWVTRPPIEPAPVRELAWQQFMYCRDIVLQGAGSLPLLARELAGNSSWFFWWD
ncbi:MAG: DUF4253 domain-containing protein [Bradymonadales bacterium]|nr:DUF4253 domain-containing protein [Bradymonadales bacterium]